MGAFSASERKKMESYYEKLGKKLKKTINADIAIISESGKALFTSFDIDQEIREVALVALKTKVRVSMLKDGANVFAIPLKEKNKMASLILTNFVISEDSFVNLILENVKCFSPDDNLSSNEKLKMDALLSHEELLKTLKEFLDNNFSVMKTAISLNVHRNTVLYRLNKIKELTGLDPKNLKDAVKLYSLFDE